MPSAEAATSASRDDDATGPVRHGAQPVPRQEWQTPSGSGRAEVDRGPVAVRAGVGRVQRIRSARWLAGPLAARARGRGCPVGRGRAGGRRAPSRQPPHDPHQTQDQDKRE